MSSKGLKVMQSNRKLPGLRSANFDLCESCIFGKQKRISFKRIGRTPKERKLELVHTDVWGPTSVQSTGGRLYFVTFIDNHSRKTWVYFMKHKLEVFEVFKRWKTMVENKTGLKVKKLGSNNRGEYEDSEFKKFCYDSGIRLERTVPDDVSYGINLEASSDEEAAEEAEEEMMEDITSERTNAHAELDDASKWELAMKDEIKSLNTNQTWKLTKLPAGKKALSNKWVYRINEEHDGSKRYNARLVVKGFQQKEGVDYTEIFSLVVKLTTIKSVLSIVAAEDLYLEQLDIKTSFLHSDLEEEIYMQ
ncbi:uncharacterized protein A4U43_C04F21630 [Asparagus officinalis]|uniref:Integrase catalytic domain-containing protein n=1 Tax=Asparagus officinalis TaxID=4686 RepID=A0A5P1F4J1_ASPOF|nr:uncharacterized protein A4U43_C04F21630 [Asparagus officinalis]